MAIVEEAARESGGRPAAKATAGAGGAEALRLGHRSIEQIAAEMRSAGVRPVEGQPLAVDILRAERDAR